MVGGVLGVAGATVGALGNAVESAVLNAKAALLGATPDAPAVAEANAGVTSAAAMFSANLNTVGLRSGKSRMTSAGGTTATTQVGTLPGV